MIDVSKLDFFLTNFFYQLIPKTKVFNNFFLFFSIDGINLLFWLIILFLVIFFEGKKNPGISQKDKKFIMTFLVSFLTTFLINNYLLKNFFKRPRPIINNQIVAKNQHCPTDFSFPSTHAVTAFAAATILVFFDKKRRWFYYLTAFLIAYSRIYLGCHYFFDVFVGAIFGQLLAATTIKLLANIE